MAKVELAHSLKEGDAIDIRARVRCVVDLGGGSVSVCAFVDLPAHRGRGWSHVCVPIEVVKPAPVGKP